MRRSDKTGPGWVAWTGSAVLLASAVVLSFTTLAELAARGGYTDWRRWLWPLTIDAAALVAIRFWLAPGMHRSASRFGLALAMAMIGLSIGGNALEHYLAGGGPLPAVLGAIPPLVLAAVGLLIDLAMRRQVDAPAVASPPASPAGDLVTSDIQPRQRDTSGDTDRAPERAPILGDRLVQLELVRPHDLPASQPAPARHPASHMDPELAAKARQLIAASENTGRRIGRPALAEQLGITTYQARQLLADYDANPPAPTAGDQTQETASA